MWISLIELSISIGSTLVSRIGFNRGKNYENGDCLRVSQVAKEKFIDYIHSIRVQQNGWGHKAVSRECLW